MTTRKTLKDFFQSKGLSQTGISINAEDTSGNGQIDEGDDIGSDPESGEKLLDLNDNTTGMLGDYVSFLMSSYNHQNGVFNGTVSNFYRPGPKNSRAPNSNRGNRTHSPLGADGNNTVFASENTTLGQTLSKYSNSGYISNLDNVVKKEGSPDNHNVISFEGTKSVNTGETFINQQIVQDAVRETIETFQGYNRYYPSKNPGDGSAYAEKSSNTNSSSTDDSVIEMYGKLGESEEIDVIRFKNLAKVASGIMEKYTGFKQSDLEGKTQEEIEEFFYNNDFSNNGDVSFKEIKANLQDSVPDLIKGDGYQILKGDMLSDERSIKFEKSDYSDAIYEDPLNIVYIGSIRLKIIIEIMLDLFGESNQQESIIDSKIIPRIRGISSVPGFIDTNYKFGECIDEGLSILFGSSQDLSNSFNEAMFEGKVKESKYFWVATFKQVIKESDRLINTLESNSSKDFLRQFSKSRIVQFANMIARIGDISLFKSNGNGLKVTTPVKKANILNVDKMPDNMSTIISKNKDSEGRISWNQGSTPSLYLMPGNISRAATSLGIGITGQNPIKSALSGRLSEQTVITPAEGDFSKIPGNLVEKLENELEASYVPFYFHDLRTNEIISFHAFLNNLTDSFSPSYNPVSGFGRMDPVQIYRSTSRTINVGFTVAATSKKDFNEMWWKINKLLTLLYPQWSKGNKVYDEETGSEFIQPFSQVIAASPMIRLRVGDVIKSNYSEYALARKFGIGNFDTIIQGRPGVKKLTGKIKGVVGLGEVNKVVDEIINAGIMIAFGSPVGLAQFASDSVEFALRGSDSIVGKKAAALVFDTRAGSSLLKLGMNQLPIQNGLAKNLYNKFKDPNVYGESFGPISGDRVVIAATLPDFPYFSPSSDGVSSRYVHILKPITAEIIRQEEIDGTIYYLAKITDIDASEDLINREVYLRFEDFIISQEHFFLDYISQYLDFLNDTNGGDFISDELSATLNKLGFSDGEFNPFKLVLQNSIFMSPYTRQDAGIGSGTDEIPTGNPYTKAFNSTKGRGLPGFINSFSMDLLSEDTSWDIDHNSRAPKLVKITLGFSPVHDITPGIDNSGFNTAPIYNIGDIMKSTSGDVWDAKGSLGERSFKRSGVVNDK